MNLRSKIITVPAVLSLVAIGLTGCGANAGEKTAAGQTPHERKENPSY
ncbi:hypothetical protein [Mobiluncus mulieris]|nr:hypothetical protein [Mobiluncus mulieris]